VGVEPIIVINWLGEELLVLLEDDILDIFEG